MKKYILDLIVTENVHLNDRYVLLKATNKEPLPEMVPGQFAELRVDNSPSTFLRRPISINNVDREKNEVWFLVQIVGEGTAHLAALKPNDILNTVIPLGNFFSKPADGEKRLLLVGGGVGTAPMLYLGRMLKEQGYEPEFLLGARSASDLLELDLFRKYGTVHITTNDGSMGEEGFVTQHSVLSQVRFDRIYCCGPKPMMQAVAKYAKENQITCEVSLENMMACGVGACLCCVENTKEGHMCVCKEGPVFNIEKLLWQI